MEKSEQYPVDETVPVVWIYTSVCQETEHRRFIKLGLEEEGIPCRVKVVQEGSAHLLSIQAAKASSLGVGIGLKESEGEAVLHHRDMPDSVKLLEIKGEMFNRDSLRKLGANSARFVKGIPLVSLVEPETSFSSGAQEDSTDFEILTNIVLEVMRILNFAKVDP